MSNKWVVDASPLILLAKVGQINLLLKLTDQLVVPASVGAEIQGGSAVDLAQAWLRDAGAREIVPDPPVSAEIAAWDLGAGETAVLGWVQKHPEFEAIVDDRAARKCAKTLNLRVRGTLGVILAGKERGLIPAARPICDDLLRAGFRIDPELLRAALALVGE